MEDDYVPVSPADMMGLILRSCGEMNEAQEHFSETFIDYAISRSAYKIAYAKRIMELSGQVNIETGKRFTEEEKRAAAEITAEEELFRYELAEAKKSIAWEAVRNKRQEVSALQTMAANVRQEMEFQNTGPRVQT